MAAWEKADPEGIYYSLLSRDSILLIDSNTLFLKDWLQDHLAIAASSSTFLVVFYINGFNEKFLGAIRVDSDGTILDTEPIVIASYRIFGPEPAVFDVIPYQNGWLIVYYGGYSTGSVHGKSVSADGRVSEELFSIQNDKFSNTGDSNIYIRQTDNEYMLSWSSFDWMNKSGNVQYSTVYNLTDTFGVISQNTLEAPYQGSQLALTTNASGNAIALWSRGSEWTFPSRPDKRKLLGGPYSPVPVLQ